MDEISQHQRTRRLANIECLGKGGGVSCSIERRRFAPVAASSINCVANVCLSTVVNVCVWLLLVFTVLPVLVLLWCNIRCMMSWSCTRIVSKSNA